MGDEQCHGTLSLTQILTWTESEICSGSAGSPLWSVQATEPETGLHTSQRHVDSHSWMQSATPKRTTHTNTSFIATWLRFVDLYIQKD